MKREYGVREGQVRPALIGPIAELQARASKPEPKKVRRHGVGDPDIGELKIVRISQDSARKCQFCNRKLANWKVLLWRNQQDLMQFCFCESDSACETSARNTAMFRPLGNLRSVQTLKQPQPMSHDRPWLLKD